MPCRVRQSAGGRSARLVPRHLTGRCGYTKLQIQRPYSPFPGSCKSRVPGMLPVCRGMCVSIVLTVTIHSVVLAENWPQWRGARHDGISRDSKVPVHFSKTEHLAWTL